MPPQTQLSLDPAALLLDKITNVKKENEVFEFILKRVSAIKGKSRKTISEFMMATYQEYFKEK